jgi:hypothetical protein
MRQYGFSPRLSRYRWARLLAYIAGTVEIILFGEGSLRRAMHEYVRATTENGIIRGIPTCYCCRGSQRHAGEESV